MGRLADWRLWFTVGFCGLIAIVAFYVADAANARDGALQIAEGSTVAQVKLQNDISMRIDVLNQRVEKLSDQLEDVRQTNAELRELIEELRQEVVKLEEE